MKNTITILLFLSLGWGSVYAGGETGNGSPIMISEDSVTGEIVSLEPQNLCEAKTTNQAVIEEVYSEQVAIAQAVERLNQANPDFSAHFIAALSLTQNPIRLPFNVWGSPIDSSGQSGPCDSATVLATQFNLETGALEVFPIFDHPKLSATSRGAIIIEATIYAVEKMFSSNPNPKLATDLMVHLVSKNVNAGQIKNITREIIGTVEIGDVGPIYRWED